MLLCFDRIRVGYSTSSKCRVGIAEPVQMKWNQRLSNLNANMERELLINQRETARGRARGRERVARARARGRAIGRHQPRASHPIHRAVQYVERTITTKANVTTGTRSATIAEKLAISKLHADNSTNLRHHRRQERDKLQRPHPRPGHVLHALRATPNLQPTGADNARQSG